MKFLRGVLAALLLPLAAFAAGESVTVSYSSQGPDRYADGSVVRDGECYALVCSKPGTVFGGFNMDGTLANPQSDDVAAVVPSAKDGHCRPVVFVVPKEYHAAHKDDAWHVYLLDTRRAGGVPAGLVNGCLARVNCYSRPDATVTIESVSARLQAALVPTGGLCAETLAASGRTPNPVITGVAVKDGKLEVQVANTVEWVTYDLAGGQKPGDSAVAVADQPADGNAAQPIVLTTKADQPVKLVRVVNRAGLFAQKESTK